MTETFTRVRRRLADARENLFILGDKLQAATIQAQERAIKKLQSRSQLAALDGDPNLLMQRELLNDQAYQLALRETREARVAVEQAEAAVEAALYEQREADRAALDRFSEAYMHGMETYDQLKRDGTRIVIEAAAEMTHVGDGGR